MKENLQQCPPELRVVREGDNIYEILRGVREGDVVEVQSVTRRILEAMPMNIPVTFKLPNYSGTMSARSNAYFNEMLLNVDFSCSISRRKPGYITITKLAWGTKGQRGPLNTLDDECE